VKRLLLDTHVVLWLRTTPERISTRALDLLRSADTELLVSAASTWEIAIKYRAGKLKLSQEPRRWMPRVLRELQADGIPVDHSAAAAVAKLPDHHRDPFDRLLIAQAQLLRVPIVTGDRAFDAYDVRTIRV
jgi:Uncharacterized protein conserved in bacteria